MSFMSAPHASAAHIYLLADALAASSITSGRQMLGSGHGSSSDDMACYLGVCGQPSTNSQLYEDFQEASEALYSGSAVDAGDEF
jgi:hypothetical protein